MTTVCIACEKQPPVSPEGFMCEECGDKFREIFQYIEEATGEKLESALEVVSNDR